MEPQGMIIRKSPYPVRETMQRFMEVLKKYDITVYAHIDQQAEAGRTGIRMPPLEYVLFGDPKKGCAIMSVTPMAALDLPLKLIAWEDTQKQVWVGYNDYNYLKARFCLNPLLARMIDINPLVAKVLAPAKTNA